MKIRIWIFTFCLTFFSMISMADDVVYMQILRNKDISEINLGIDCCIIDKRYNVLHNLVYLHKSGFSCNLFCRCSDSLICQMPLCY